MLVIGYVEGAAGDGSTILPAGERVSIESWQGPDGSSVIPFFSSRAALQRAIDREVRFARCPPARCSS